ncbi:MAG: four helix bundle protein [Prevotella sp.]|jgi:hypothetical protein|nr:four helix bundle protein [Prevotella sp.]
MESHKNLIVWQQSIDLVKSVYSVMHSFYHEVLFGLGSQKECKRFIHTALKEDVKRFDKIIKYRISGKLVC